MLTAKGDVHRSERGTRRRKKDVDRRAREPPAVSARRQVQHTLGRHVDRISALPPDHLRIAGAHPLGLAELVRIVREEIFAGRDDGDVGARESRELPALFGEGDRAGDPSGQDLRHNLWVADRNLLFHCDSEDSGPGARATRRK
jgi:hypothetical protein